MAAICSGRGNFVKLRARICRRSVTVGSTSFDQQRSLTQRDGAVTTAAKAVFDRPPARHAVDGDPPSFLRFRSFDQSGIPCDALRGRKLRHTAQFRSTIVFSGLCDDCAEAGGDILTNSIADVLHHQTGKNSRRSFDHLVGAEHQAHARDPMTARSNAHIASTVCGMIFSLVPARWSVQRRRCNQGAGQAAHRLASRTTSRAARFVCLARRLFGSLMTTAAVVNFGSLSRSCSSPRA
jgi:hypothetical protein